MAELEVLRFHNPNAFSGLTGQVDHQNAIVHGVALITGGLEAEGHNLYVDDKTVKQLHELAIKLNKLPVCLDHDGGIADVDGYLTNFYVDQNKLRGDWHMLQTHPETPIMLERAERQPNTFGLSVAFKGDKKGVLENGRACARAEALLGADVVKRPAANPDGLFAVPTPKLTTNKNVMPEQQTQEPTISDLMQAINSISGRLDQHDQFNQQLVDHLNGGGQGGGEGYEAEGPSLQDFANMSDAELAEYTDEQGNPLTRDIVNQAVDEYIAQAEGHVAPQPQAEVAPGAAVPVGGGTGAELQHPNNAMVGQPTQPAAMAAQFEALQKQVIELQKHNKRLEFAAKQEAENIEFSDIVEKVKVLEAQRNEAIRLFEEVKAENEALKLAVKTGTRPTKAGVDNGVRLFAANGEGELHQFQVLVKSFEAQGKTHAESIRLARKEPNGIALHADWVESQRTTRT
jgi:hypothetical protein